MRKILFTIVITFFTSLSHAIPISVDDSVFGADSITLDTSTNLEWLDVYLTNGRSINDLTGVDGTNEFNIGGDFDGFRLASEKEVIYLFETNGVFLQSPTNPTTVIDATALVDLLGGSNYSSCCIIAGTSTPGPFWGFSHPLINNGLFGGPGYNLANPKRPYETRYGAYLVRSVPEPSTAALLFIGLLVLRLKSNH